MWCCTLKLECAESNQRAAREATRRYIATSQGDFHQALRVHDGDIQISGRFRCSFSVFDPEIFSGCAHALISSVWNRNIPVNMPATAMSTALTAVCAWVATVVWKHTNHIPSIDECTARSNPQNCIKQPGSLMIDRIDPLSSRGSIASVETQDVGNLTFIRTLAHNYDFLIFFRPHSDATRSQHMLFGFSHHLCTVAQRTLATVRLLLQGGAWTPASVSVFFNENIYNTGCACVTTKSCRS